MDALIWTPESRKLLRYRILCGAQLIKYLALFVIAFRDTYPIYSTSLSLLANAIIS